MLTLQEAERRLHDLMHGDTRWLYAFAMGAGCTTETGNHEVYQAIRDRDSLLRSVIKEHKG